MEDRRLIIPILTEGHSYSVNGRQLVAVTTVIHTVLRAPALEEWMKRMGPQADRIRDEAAAFGKSIHAALATHLTGCKLLPLDMPENWHKTIQAGRDWIDANVEEVLAVEQPIASLAYGYAGTPDLYCRLKGQKLYTFIDWKTTAAVYPSHRYQTAAYRKAGVETYGDRPANRMVLLFSKDVPGKVTAHHFRSHGDDFTAFTYCLGLYNIQKAA